MRYLIIACDCYLSACVPKSRSAPFAVCTRSNYAYLVGRLWVVGVLVGMQFEGHLPVRLLDLVGSGRLGQTQQLVQRVARRAACRLE